MPGFSDLQMSINPPSGKRYWFDASVMPKDKRGEVKPVFRVAEVARTFFGKSSDWLRLLIKEHAARGQVFVLDGKDLITHRTDTGNRIYNLADIELMAHALLQSGKIDVRQFITTLNILRWVAYSYQILTDRDMQPQQNPTRPRRSRASGEQLPIPGL